VCFFQYYSLDITYFKSSLDSHLLDLLWNKYWVNTLVGSYFLVHGVEIYVKKIIEGRGKGCYLCKSVWFCRDGIEREGISFGESFVVSYMDREQCSL